MTFQRVCEKCSMHFETTQFWDLCVRRIAWILGRGLCFLRSFLGFGPTWPRCPTWVNWTGHCPLQSFVTHEIIWKGEHKNWTILSTELYRYALRKKTILFGNFSQTSDPPPPPLLGTPYPKNFFKCLFCILEPKEHFCSSKKKSFFRWYLEFRWSNLLKVLGIGDPPPLLGKVPK